MDTSGCLRYYPNEWMTFMVHLRMGPEGRAVSSVTGISQPGFINSTYDFYVARQGQPLDLAHHQEGVVIPRGQFWNASVGVNPDNPNDPGYGSTGWSAHDAHPNAKYGKVWLTPYHTNKDPTEVTENASIWYDEVIVSTQPIASPGGAVAPAPTPTHADATRADRVAVDQYDVGHLGRERDAHLVLAERQLLHGLRGLERLARPEWAGVHDAVGPEHDVCADLRGNRRFGLPIGDDQCPGGTDADADADHPDTGTTAPSLTFTASPTSRAFRRKKHADLVLAKCQLVHRIGWLERIDSLARESTHQRAENGRAAGWRHNLHADLHGNRRFGRPGR